MTLDAREAFRLAIVAPVRRRLRPRRDAEPVHALQRELPLRAAARVREARRRVEARDGPLRPDRRAPRPAPARAGRRPGEGPVVHARPARSAAPRAALVPARRAVEGGDEGGGGAGRALGRAPRREPGGVLPRGSRLPRRFSSATACRPGRGGSSTRHGETVGSHDGFWRFTPGPAPGPRRLAPDSPRMRWAAIRRRTPSSSALARRSPGAPSPHRAGCSRR